MSASMTLKMLKLTSLLKLIKTAESTDHVPQLRPQLRPNSGTSGPAMAPANDLCFGSTVFKLFKEDVEDSEKS